MKLIVGLGNPGKEYENTRHNIGYMVLDNYLGSISWKKDKLAYIYKTKDVIYIKPTTYMNLSGTAIYYYMNYYKIDINDLLVIQDDLDLELGTLKIKINSSSGGHNGIKNIIDNIHSNSFLRLKIGISKPSDEIIDYVLSKFNKKETQKLCEILPITKNIIDDFIDEETPEILMNRYN